MRAEELVTKGDIKPLIEKLEELSNKLDGTFSPYISSKKLEEEYDISGATLWRLEKRGALIPKRLPGSTKKFYSITEFIAALESE